MTTSRLLPDPAATLALGAELATDLGPGAVVGLDGPLGAGKTLLAKGIVAALGYPGPVTSPTFALIHEYRGGRLPVFHFDFYRAESADEILSAGWDDYLDEQGVIVVEWASKFPSLLPAQSVRVMLDAPTHAVRSADILIP